MDDGTYVLKDEDTGTYIYTSDGNTFSDPVGGYNHNQLILVTSEDNVFGAGIDSVSRASMERARQSLERVNHIRQFFDGFQKNIVEKLILVYDDEIGSENGENAYANRGTAIAFTGTNLFDASIFEISEPVGLIGIGTVYSEDPVQYADIYAHEYTHVVSRILVDWASYQGENGALNEAYSDIFAELYEGYLKQGSPDWLHGVLMRGGNMVYVSRNIQNPQDNTTYPVRDNRVYPIAVSQNNRVNPHIGATIISHIAYKLSMGDSGVSGSAISYRDLGTLWFKSMLHLTSNADFLECRTAVILAAEEMGLSQAQKNWIERCFDDAGIIANVPNVDFQVADVFTVNIWEPDNTRCEDCDVTVRQAVEVYGPVLPMDAPIRWNSSNSEQCHLKLDPGYYTLTVQVHGEPGETKKYTIQVMPDDSGEKEIDIHTNIGRAMLDVQIRGKEGGKEVSLPDASIEIYRDNPNQLVYMGNGAERRFYLRPDNYTVVVTAPGYQPEQMSFRMQDNSIRYSHSFLLEPVAQDPSGDLPVIPEPITGGVPYEVLSWEASYTGQADGTEFTNRYIYEYIVLQGDDPAYEAINRDLYRLAQEQWNKILDGPLQYLHQDRGEVCKDYEEYIAARVTHNGNGIISILMGPDQAVTYSLYNGARLGLHILSGDHQVEYLKTIQKTVATNNASELGLSDFGFAVMDSEIVILGTAFPGGSLFGPYSRMIHTGLYVSTEYTERLKGTLRATGGTGSASYEILELDRSYLRRGRPDCLQSMIHVCQYPVASGAAAAGQISQEAYDLARQFIDAFPDELTNTSNRYEFDWECNRYSDDERISSGYEGVQYNNNGILCYVMDWKVELKHYRDGQKFIGAERYDGLYGITYDLQTGAHLTLQQVTGMDEKTQQLMLRDAYGRVYNYYYLNSHRMSYDPAGFSLEDPAFFIDRDGQIMLHFSVTEQFEADYLADLPKTAHTFVVTLPTELYVLGS